MLLRRLIRIFGLAHLMLGALAATLLLTEPSTRRYGDTLQIVLPVLAWGCSTTKGSGRDFAMRFVAMLAVAHGSKSLLGDTPLNQRPSGHGHGFPSGHTGAAALGASSLAHDCLQGSAGAQAVVVIAAAFVGASRIEVGAHDIWQVLAGAILGWAADRALRRDSRVRHGLVAATGPIGVQIRHILRRVRSASARLIDLRSRQGSSGASRGGP
jgi:membrane-associated phospholipid phosphatase